MKKTLLSIGCLVIAFMAHAQAPVPTLQWAKNMGGSSDDFGLSVAMDASGNVYTTGFFQGTADLDPSSASFNVSSAGSDDIFISKLDASGNLVWAKKMGASGSDKGNSIAVDASGNVYATGWFNGTVDFDPSASATFNLVSAGSSDAFIVKLDASGNFVWAKQIGSTGGDNGRGIVVDAGGNSYTTGNFTGTVDFDPSAATFTVASAGGQDAFVSRLDATGNFVWAKTMGGTADDKGFSVDLDASGNVFINGEFAGTADMDPGAAVANLVSGGATDLYVCKLDATGNYVWAKDVMSSTADDWATALKVNAGNVYVTGQFSGTADADPSAVTYTLASNGGYDAFVSKIDASGNLVWAKSFGGTSDDNGRAVAVDGAGKVYVAGSFQNTTDFDPAAATSYTLTSNGSNDIFILNLDASGNYVWAGQIGGSGYDDAFYISSDAAGNLVTTGTFKVNPDFNPNTSPTMVNTLTSAGSNDIFVMKLFPCASPVSATNATALSRQTICVSTTATLSATTSTGTVSWFSSATSTLALGTGTNYITPVMAAGNYTYYAESSTCAPSATRTAITLTVNALPVVTANDGVICQGQSFTMLPTGASTYIYSSGSPVVSPNSTTFYSILGFDAIGCKSLPATSIVTVMPSPAITAASSSSMICAGESATLTASGVSSYTWSTGSNAASIVVSPSVNTTYSVASLGTNGCTGVALLTQNVSLCTGLHEISAGSSPVVIYPNPSSGLFTIEAENTFAVSVYDVLGNILMTYDVMGGKQSIDLHPYANGIYLAKVTQAGRVQTIRLIKQ